jgi:hypothetical protein
MYRHGWMVRADDSDAFLNHSLKPRSMSNCGFIDPRNGTGDQLALQPHERNWYLQVSSGAGAQAVVNGAFGVRPQSGNATLVIAPHFNASMMAGDARLTNYHFRNATFSHASGGGMIHAAAHPSGSFSPEPGQNSSAALSA